MLSELMRCYAMPNTAMKLGVFAILPSKSHFGHKSQSNSLIQNAVSKMTTRESSFFQPKPKKQLN